MVSTADKSGSNVSGLLRTREEVGEECNPGAASVVASPALAWRSALQAGKPSLSGVKRTFTGSCRHLPPVLSWREG